MYLWVLPGQLADYHTHFTYKGLVSVICLTSYCLFMHPADGDSYAGTLAFI